MVTDPTHSTGARETHRLQQYYTPSRIEEREILVRDRSRLEQPVPGRTAIGLRLALV